MNETIYGVLIGSVLGFLATLCSAQIASYFNKRSVIKSYEISLKLEFNDTVKTLDQIRNAQERQKFYDYNLLNLLDKNVENLQDSRKSTFLLKNKDVQSEVFDVINKLSLLATEIRGVQDYEYKIIDNEKEKKDRDIFVKDKRSSSALQIIDIRRDLTELEKKV